MCRLCLTFKIKIIMTEFLLGMGLAFIIFGILMAIFTLIAIWFLFEKAGQPGWAAIIPIFNLLVLLRVANKPWWWIFGILLGIIPWVGSILMVIWSVFIWHGVSKNFGKGIGFTVGLVLLNLVFVPILAFGKASYKIVE